MKLLANKDVNTGRQFEVDMAKAVCLFGMILAHAMDAFGSAGRYAGAADYFFGVGRNSTFGAATFMFCMGIGIVYSGSSPKNLMKRGIKLFLLGYLLNLLGALSYLTVLHDASAFLNNLAGLDILQFAGLSLFLYGLMRKLSSPLWAILLTAVLLSVIGSFLRGLDLGSAGSNILLGLFIGTFDHAWMTGGIFPLFNWFIFVAAGSWFGRILRRCLSKNRLYAVVCTVTGAVMVLYVLYFRPVQRGVMSSIFSLHQLTTPEAVVLLAGTMFSLGVYHAVSHILPKGLKTRITALSRSVSTVYCVQWVLISWGTSFWLRLGQPTLSDRTVILIGIGVFLICLLTARTYTRVKSGRTAAKGKKKKTVTYVAKKEQKKGKTVTAVQKKEK